MFSLTELKARIRKWGMDGRRGKDGEAEALTMVVLFHKGSKEPVETPWDLSSREYTVDDLASEIENVVKDDVKGMDGAQYYILKGYFGQTGNPESSLAGARYCFDIISDAMYDATNDGGGDEKPTPTGFTQQTMRLRERELGLTFAATKVIIGEMREMIQDLRSDLGESHRMVNEGMKRQLEAARMLEEMNERKHERLIEMKELESEHNIKESFINSAQLLAPVLLSKFTMNGKKENGNGHDTTQTPVPNLFAEEVEALRKLFAKPEFSERMPMIIGALDHFQSMFLMHFATKLGENAIGMSEVAGLQMFLQRLKPPTYRKLYMAMGEEGGAILDSMLNKILPPEESATTVENPQGH